MKRSLAAITSKGKALLCVGLTLANLYFTSCGPARLDVPITAAMYQLRLSKDHELSKALRESNFDDATGIEIYPAEQRFRLVFRDRQRHVGGTYAFVGGEFTITGFSFTHEGQTATMDFSEAKQITRIATSEGLEWKRPAETIARSLPPGASSGAEAYAAANADLLEYAAELDRQLGDDKGPPGKTDAALIGVLAGVLIYTAILWAPVAGTLQVLFTVFTVSFILQNVMIFRFDGSWLATNAGSTLALTIENGRITRLVDQNAGQALTIVRSDLQDVSGTLVTWNVRAQLAGQEVPVDFEFEMEEMANGRLQGFLTVTGNTLGRVPIDMTRST